MMKGYLAATVVALLALGACGESEDPEAIQQRVELKPFSSCQQLEGYIKDNAVRQMRLRLEQSLDSELKWRDAIALPSADAGMAAPTSPQAGAGPGQEPSAYTTTNTQDNAVDEPDFVKNDGTRILVLSNKTLYTAKSWPPSDLATTGKLSLEGTPTEMFLDKDRVVVFSSIYSSYFKAGDGSCIWGDCSSSVNATKVTVVDVSDLAKPKEVEALFLPGSFHSARRVGSAVRIVLSDSFRWPAGMGWYPEYSKALHDDVYRLKAAFARLIDDNAALIQAQELSSWMPVARAKLADGKLVDVSYSCSDFYYSNAPVRLAVASVVSLNLDKLDAQPQRTSIIGGVDEIYASKSSLYLAGAHWWWRSRPGQQSHTYLHKFDITDPNKARYVASGGVDGTLVDQFAMDEHKGYFRAATTITSTSEDTTSSWGWTQTETANRVSVMAEKAGRIEVIGATQDLAKGERIYSVRFQGERGYVVTFRQVDPLFTLDLSKPTKPVVVGELKVPGFSTYIHPLDDSHLLTIGVHQDATTSGWGWGEQTMKLTIFDVSDLKNPKEKFTRKVGTAYGWSEAAYEHKAFNYFAAHKLLAIPFSDYEPYGSSGGGYWSSFVSEVRVFSIDTAKGINPLGALSLKDVYEAKNDYSWHGYYSPWIRRSVMASDQQGNAYVYAIADVGIRVATAADPSTPIQTALFQ